MPTKADYAKIAIACNKLGIDRKQLISDRYGLESAKDLSTKQLRDLFSHLRSQGFAATSSNDFIVVPNSTLHADLKRKILVMWRALDYSIPGINVRAQKQFGIEKFVWIKDADALNTLKRDLNKRLRDRGLDPDCL